MEEHLQDILGSHGDALGGRHIALGVSGSVAALETHRVARLLMRHGAQVHVVLSPSASELVSSKALHWATGNPVVTSLSGACEHLKLVGEHGLCHAFLVAPATANTIGKMALGIDDTPLTTVAVTALGRRLPSLVAPGMHACMFDHPAVGANLGRLTEMGVRVIAPERLEAKAKMATPEVILAEVARLLGPGSLSGKRVLMTGGPTREPLDPARYLTNPSSGRMACSLAAEAYRRGAEVHLIYGPGPTDPPPGVRVERVERTAQMLQAVERALTEPYHYFLGVAAVADFAPLEVSATKLPTAAGPTKLTLQPTPKVIDRVRQLAPDIRLVAFKALPTQEPEELWQAARATAARCRADLVLANPVGLPGVGFESEENLLWAVPPQGQAESLGQASKTLLAARVWDRIEQL
ncbi:MAG: bifunctional phosphopantothenoylcysteine decarboxylase/phosphopantothenate--cysteine ligase CoaBC [Vulcanimicrobiota bacterium]